MSDNSEVEIDRGELLRMTAEIVSAFASNNELSSDQLAEVIQSVHGTLGGLNKSEAEVQEKAPKPAVSIKRSIHPDYLICLEDGKKLKMLKRYLRSNYDMTPEEYRAKWSLASDYPMVAPNYAKQRSEFAKSIGLGKNGRGRGQGKR